MQAVETARGAARVRFNPIDPAFHRDPYPTYAHMRVDAPHLRTMGTLVLTRYADVLAALKTRELSVALIPETIERSARALGAGDIDEIGRFIRNSIVFTDNPEHLRLRRLINQAYAAPMLAALTPLIDAQADALFDAIERNGGHTDFIADFARPLPVNVLCAWMRVPEEQREWIACRIHNVRYLLDPGLLDHARFEHTRSSLAELTAFFIEHMRGMADDDDGIIAVLRGARSDGDCLSETEVAFACIMSFVAGTETSESLIGNLFHLVLRHADAERALRQDMGLAQAAINETIRYETPLQMTKRVARGAHTINGLEVRAGEQILLCLGAANRDADAFDAPDTFQLDRRGVPHVGFGYGMHACLGGVLAQRQAMRALARGLERFPVWQRLSDDICWQTHSVILRGLETLPVAFGHGAQAAR